jgi:hypothetical protein
MRTSAAAGETRRKSSSESRMFFANVVGMISNFDMIVISRNDEYI